MFIQIQILLPANVVMSTCETAEWSSLHWATFKWSTDAINDLVCVATNVSLQALAKQDLPRQRD
jgi:hypothetical protein